MTFRSNIFLYVFIVYYVFQDNHLECYITFCKFYLEDIYVSSILRNYLIGQIYCWTKQSSKT